MAIRYDRGSEWRKWDLHIHPPGTKLSNHYSDDDWGRFCELLEKSDVAAFGITDYFSFDGYLRAVDEFEKHCPGSGKLLLPNLELRLPEALNRAGDIVDIHLILRPDPDGAYLTHLLHELKTQLTDERGRQLNCAQLSEKQYEQATVTRRDIDAALRATFGPNYSPDDAIIVVPAGNNGIRAAGPGKQRKAALADETDKLVHAIFGGSQNVEWFLSTERFEDPDQPSLPKPVFAASDCHSMAHIEERLGKSVKRDGESREVTWIKADPTYDGLLQTLIEPAERVRIQDGMPDPKDAYKVISQVTFSGTGDFPETPIVLNSNLVSVIGSRSSGKSALLAYISHSLDPAYTVDQQVKDGTTTEDSAGPAAGKTWADVEHISCTVEWASGGTSNGKVIYIPQNTLYNVSERPQAISEKILPVLQRLDQTFETTHGALLHDLDTTNARIRDAVAEWFSVGDALRENREHLRDLGSPAEVQATVDILKGQYAEQQVRSNLSPEDVSAYEVATAELEKLQSDQAGLAAERVVLDRLAPPAAGSVVQPTNTVDVSIKVSLGSSTVGQEDSMVPAALSDRIGEILARATTSLGREIASEVEAYRAGISSRATAVADDLARKTAEHQPLLDRVRANEELEQLGAKIRRLETLISEISQVKEQIVRLETAQATHASTIDDLLAERDRSVTDFVDAFASRRYQIDEMSFGVESGLSKQRLEAVSSMFNRQENTGYFQRANGDLIDLAAVHNSVSTFLKAVASGAQKLKTGQDAVTVAAEVLTVTETIEFFAEMDDDRIGGFKPSSMTPGKRALFALTLLIGESEDAWPILLDQPEDDLDSRSIYSSIVPFLMKRKKSRQIIMVSHNPNLVVGADSEQVIIANRHGDDRQNVDKRTFDYLTGALEWSTPHTGTQPVLSSGGVREHACDVLDGGKEAFDKRRQKYKI